MRRSYNADGMLVGLRSLQSTGCKPLDEHLLISHRHFATAFSEPGKPDLDDVTVELAPGTPKDAVRLVKRGSTQVLDRLLNLEAAPKMNIRLLREPFSRSMRFRAGSGTTKGKAS